MRPRRALGLAASAALALSACGGRGNVLGPGASVCFRALPPAFDAVQHQGHLVGVRLMSEARAGHHLGSSTMPQLPSGTATTTAVSPSRPVSRQVCLVAFRGSFPTNDFARSPRARYAIVVVDARHFQVLRTVVRDRLPLRFRHRA